MRRLLLLLALPLALAVAPALPAQADSVTLDGVSVALASPRTRQVVTVNHTRGHHARVSWWVRTSGGWERRLQASDGRTGYGGLVRARLREQGTGTTPLGTFRLLSAFGMRAGDGYAISYRRVRRGDYWVQDNRSAHYNRYRNKAQGGFRWWLPSSDYNASERLLDYPKQYEWAINTGFNRAQVRRRGAGIFLHVNGSGATAGCISAPRWLIRAVMHRIDAAAAPVIAVGR